MRVIRRSDRIISLEAGIEILKNNTYGILSLIDEDGMPYGVPINYAYYDDEIIMHGALEGKKMDAIAHRDQACFTVVDKANVVKEAFTTDYSSVILFGRIKSIEDNDLKRDYLIKFLNHYNISQACATHLLETQIDNTAVLVIAIESLSVKGKE